MNWLDRILIRLLLRRRVSYFRIVKVKGRNISVNIEEYIPAHEMFAKMEEKLHEFS